ncbi:MAG: peptidase U32 family protein [Bacteroidales bacterium]
MKNNSVEIMSPVGSYESLMAAIQGGADAVYFGVGKLNMRARSSVNFSLDDLEKITAICRENKVRSYLTLNTVVFDEELSEIQSIVDAAQKHGISAIIASDISVLEYTRSIGMEVHISTQCNITNLAAVKFYSRFADVMVTARELKLEQVASIIRQIEEQKICGPSGKLVKIEIFIHGALCMAVSGKCYLSLDNFNHSANRGACLQPCRRGYTVKDKETELELEVDHEYIMSPKDLKTVDFLDKIINAGVTVLKIEGRGRSPEYVKTATRVYRQAVDAIFDGTYTQENIDHWNAALSSVYNRSFWDGYYLGRKLGEWSGKYGSQATLRKEYVGKVTNYYANLNVAEIRIEAQPLNIGDTINISGTTTGVYEGSISEIRIDLNPAKEAIKGELCSIPVTALVRRNDKLYKLIENV